MKRFILFPTYDFKYVYWSKELESLGYNTWANRKSNALAPFFLLKLLLDGCKVDAYVFRYLNTRRSFIKSFLLVCANFAVIAICKFWNVNVYWILHNVDKETYDYHKCLSRFNRFIVKKYSKRIFVTDPLLIPKTVQKGFSEKKIDWISLGPPSDTDVDNRNIRLKININKFRETLQRKSGKKKVYMGLCVSSSMPKYYHFLYSVHLVSIASENCVIGLVLIGKIPKEEKFKNVKKDIYKNNHILYIEDNFPVNERYLSDEIDFIYRCVSDLSLPYTTYVAASIGKPIISHNIGFLPEMISEYGLGHVVSIPLDSSSTDIFKFFQSWNPEAAIEFLAHRSWRDGAKKLIAALNLVQKK